MNIDGFELPEEYESFADYTRNMAEMELTFTYKRRRELLSLLEITEERRNERMKRESLDMLDEGEFPELAAALRADLGIDADGEEVEQ